MAWSRATGNSQADKPQPCDRWLRLERHREICSYFIVYIHCRSKDYIMSEMKNLIISEPILEKLDEKHGVCRREVEQCFENLDGPLLIDDREDHKSDPPTLWFLARTNRNRLLKVVYIQRGQRIFLRTCYEPNETEISIYEQMR